MTEHNKAAQARKGLIDSVKGKAKEIAGAVTGNDSLTAEGQLEQTQAQQRKEANSVEAVADAEAAQARADATRAKLEGADERLAVSARQRPWRIPSELSRPLKTARPSRPDNATLPEKRPRPNSTPSARCSARKPRSATKSAPPPRNSSTPWANIRPRCGRQPVPRRKPTGSDGRPTV